MSVQKELGDEKGLNMGEGAVGRCVALVGRPCVTIGASLGQRWARGVAYVGCLLMWKVLVKPVFQK